VNRSRGVVIQVNTAHDRTPHLPQSFASPPKKRGGSSEGID
jgi:hypothetical protein